ncbi:hypothetical protein LTR35_002549 [Friedmanniomyces endolithicus]|uniref:Prefoldin subunit 1 n=1 Tax=Friedmanniomyces endolithicus TaxID=329885 RepID=A0AAN6FS54_9PEZI|nr:hypothetical protein LTR35_002549 [Friedmanniomyces endolithicus]KAK0291470.1 hypothetical protein LTS00_008470 [Friedmanniomyces endolithicus]KAK0323499.1 hypothetical protein LTR82_005246 [Friedmanniomyces endolithicus]KAK1019946.1 hypothetical protein LTR54_000590 [Friedmanniomyces endolithicus]
MAIPNEKLQQLLQEISSKAQFAEQQLGIVNTQIASKKRESRRLQLSDTEMDALPKDTPVYDGVGKMQACKPEPVHTLSLLTLPRFVLTSTGEVKNRQAKEAEDIKKELANLDKKQHYLETTFKNSQDHMEQILKRGG